MTFLYYQRCFYKQTLENTEGVIKNGESQETGNIGYTRHRTNKRQRIPKGQSKMENPKKLVTQDTQDTGQINVREYRSGNQKWTIQRNWQHRVHKTKKNKAQTEHNMCWTPLYVILSELNSRPHLSLYFMTRRNLPK